MPVPPVPPRESGVELPQLPAESALADKAMSVKTERNDRRLRPAVEEREVWSIVTDPRFRRSLETAASGFAQGHTATPCTPTPR